jgi:hypothetical protein
MLQDNEDSKGRQGLSSVTIPAGILDGPMSLSTYCSNSDRVGN